MSDATVDWLLNLGTSADVGARGYTSETWIAWLSEDLAPAGAELPRGRHPGATQHSAAHTRGMPRLMPVSLGPAALSVHRKAAAELLGGLGVLPLHSTSADAEEQAAIRAFDLGVERPPLTGARARSGECAKPIGRSCAAAARVHATVPRPMRRLRSPYA